MRSVFLFVFILTLTGCAPDTSAAYKNCVDTLTLAVEYDETLTYDQRVEKMIDIALLCSDLAEANPERFNEEWGN